MIDRVYKCDVCGASRGPANHWLLFDADGIALIVSKWYDDVVENNLTVQHICGAACAHKVLDRYLGSLREGR